MLESAFKIVTSFPQAHTGDEDLVLVFAISEVLSKHPLSPTWGHFRWASESPTTAGLWPNPSPAAPKRKTDAAGGAHRTETKNPPIKGI